MLLMAEKGIREGIYHTILQNAKANNEYMKYFFNIKNVHIIIKFYQKAWLNQNIDMYIDLRKKAENDFEKDFFKLMNNTFFVQTMENVRKLRDIKLLTTEKKKKLFAITIKLS